MRTAPLAILEYLIGFIALAFFAYLAFGRGQTTDESFVFAFKASSFLAIGELVFLLARTAPANRLILGANLWLIAGGTRYISANQSLASFRRRTYSFNTRYRSR
jgi:hypothetical protein